MSDPMESPIFAQRRIEAKILKQVYETLIESHGPEVAKKTIADSVRKASIEQAGEMAEGVETSTLSFIELMKGLLGGHMKLIKSMTKSLIHMRDVFRLPGSSSGRAY